jgi:hypothetical protein
MAAHIEILVFSVYNGSYEYIYIYSTRIYWYINFSVHKEVSYAIFEKKCLGTKFMQDRMQIV